MHFMRRRAPSLTTGRSNQSVRRVGCGLVIAVLACLMAACSPRLMLVNSIADELARQGGSPEDDLLLARDAGAFYLKLSEALLLQTPGNLALAEAVSGGFTQYAYAFVAFEADKTEARDAKAALKMRERAARLYRRANGHAMASLEGQIPGFARALASPDPSAWPRLEQKQIALAYWAAASWGGQIALSKDNPDVVADLPLAMRLATLAWRVEPDHADGALSSLMGSFEAARPGGSAARAASYFDRAISRGAGKIAGPYLAKAEALAKPAGDRDAFETLLRKALAASTGQPDLQNAVMQERARWLLDNVDDLF